MKQKDFNLTIIVVTAIVVGLGLMLSPAVMLADDSERGVFMVSNDLFDALEAWSGREIGYEEVAFDSYPDAIRSYGESLREVTSGRALGEVFIDNYPVAANEFQAVTEGEIRDDIEFLAYVMSHRQGEYQRWQAEVAQEGGSTFRDHVANTYPEMVAYAMEANIAPADRRVSLASFVGQLGREDLVEELRDILGPDDGPTDRGCECWVLMATPSVPYHLKLAEPQHEDVVWGFPTKRRVFDFNMVSLGAAKAMRFYRGTSMHANTKDRIEDSNYSALRVRLHCAENGVPGGQRCTGASCTGELALGMEYGSRVHEAVQTAGIFSRRSQALATDVALLRHDPPGSTPEITLLEKGVAVSGDFKTEWDSEALVQTLLAGTELVITVENFGVGGVQQDLINELVDGIVGLIQREGETGSQTESMLARFETSTSEPFTLLPDRTYLFTLDSRSRTYGSGYGELSQSVAEVSSSNFLAAVVQNFQCSGGARRPAPGACWLWAAMPDAPHDGGDLQGLVHDFVKVQLGAAPTGVSDHRNCYP